MTDGKHRPRLVGHWAKAKRKQTKAKIINATNLDRFLRLRTKRQASYLPPFDGISSRQSEHAEQMRRENCS
ncbi:hypothetical protein scyTo_0003732 [Scyliorhinus torazame]|uniref:Uncharacterized protein n=1 Tax=Scyliorhinus torazame TaxID=75743 RepID=A0A401PNI8_SCYTO|nr:hypothetical protein [Scyliorhinus torazame]